MKDGVSVIIPASNEAALIGPCLDSLLASDGPEPDQVPDQVPVKIPVQVIVVANGCTDATATRARAAGPRFAARDWTLTVVELAEGSKPKALNAGDAVARHGARAYLDADVTLSPGLLAALLRQLSRPEPTYASGQIEITAQGWVARRYAAIWRRVPFMADCVPGCGLFAVNAAGRARWDRFPEIISDDTFVRLHFAPAERCAVAETFHWPIAEGLRALLRVRRRQDAGVDEIARCFPALLQNDDSRPFDLRQKLRLAMLDPAGFGLYGGVALASRLTRNRAAGWSRGR